MLGKNAEELVDDNTLLYPHLPRILIWMLLEPPDLHAGQAPD